MYRVYRFFDWDDIPYYLTTLGTWTPRSEDAISVSLARAKQLEEFGYSFELLRRQRL